MTLKRAEEIEREILDALVATEGRLPGRIAEPNSSEKQPRFTANVSGGTWIRYRVLEGKGSRWRFWKPRVRRILITWIAEIPAVGT